MARKAAGRLKKYDPTNTAVAIQPRICCVTALVSTSSRNRGCRDHDPLGPGPLPIVQDQACDSNSARICEVRSPNTWCSIGTSTLQALSLKPVVLAMRANWRFSETAVVK